MQGTETAKFLKVESNVSKMTADPAWRSLKRRPAALGVGGSSPAMRFESGELFEYEEEDIQTSVWSAWCVAVFLVVALCLESHSRVGRFNMPPPPPPDTGRLQHLSATIDSLEWLADRIDAEFAENQDHIR